ncbi:type II toxin-antitoxin system PemK/MazF family toxin [Mariniphaga sediminis]|jgi:mRNA interferase MazF|uniref:mRNA interferase n=1 Tax=Mariniphaga sediminis TaxID=1628158 RepID=A0A399CW25_9BACT|nr:type II toxin-antitoxin system PemK/MazF family toxin [Mariniphaga sediminis]RIH62792.1 type II toxin-antitoxin system PemK/MazF family toxin [Mariniphaga sediminis]
MKQCEIWYADLNPVKGSEQEGYRPVVIISGNVVNTLLNVVIACPLTTKIKEYKGNIVLDPDPENGLARKSEILIFHVRSISKERLVKKMGTITPQQLEKLKQGLNDILKY